jgi:hypothetical protein
MGTIGRRVTAVLCAAAVLVQLASISLWYNLEESQAAYWRQPVFMPWQRLVNLAAAVSGRFEPWGLWYPGFTSRSLLPNFLPFLMARHLSPALRWFMVGLWGVSAGALIWVVAVGARSLLIGDEDVDGPATPSS